MGTYQETGQAAMKAELDEPEDGIQDQLDEITRLSVKNAKEIYHRMFAPIRKLAEECGDLTSLKEAMENEATLDRLYQDMDVEEFTDLLHQGLYLAELIGRCEA